MLLCLLSLTEEPGPAQHVPQAPGHAENLIIYLGLSHICFLGLLESLSSEANPRSGLISPEPGANPILPGRFLKSACPRCPKQCVHALSSF